ncbi:glycosyltransferase [Desulfolutivibrio sulfoxidireducens]|uniref:glycosyltransferase n=1 Tax=Desulfolutivibrio sulfoxidireducens TaxID=2773299 RepID=UPI001FEB151A|nr:glycosyltransferase [Desulfolutivibrio sulfoxidireducens]
MRIVMIAENDPAGVGSLLRSALVRHTDHVCRLVTTQTRYNHGYEKDLHVPGLDAAGLDELAGVLEAADAFHFHMLADEHMPLGPLTAAPFLAGKAVVHHHHGHPVFRSNPRMFQEKYRDLGRANLLVSTPDLLRLLPGARWQPNLVPQNAPLYRPSPRATDGRVRLGHSPTRKDIKNTADLVAVHARLAAEMPWLDLEVVDDVPHVECLARKQACDMVFDHMQGYYGMSSLEALSQGLPTIAGLDDWNLAAIRDFFQRDDLPWVVARTREELETVVRRLALDPDERRRIGRASRRFMETAWSEKRLAASWSAVYENLHRPVPSGRGRVVPVASGGAMGANPA